MLPLASRKVRVSGVVLRPIFIARFIPVRGRVRHSASSDTLPPVSRFAFPSEDRRWTTRHRPTQPATFKEFLKRLDQGPGLCHGCDQRLETSRVRRPSRRDSKSSLCPPSPPEPTLTFTSLLPSCLDTLLKLRAHLLCIVPGGSRPVPTDGAKVRAGGHQP